MCHGLLKLPFIFLFLHSSLQENQNPLVLLISFDGFRYDLVNETMVPHIFKWARGGTWFVNGSQSQYVSFTAPNHMSIATGMYEESHGIVSNYFYDTKDNKTFDYFNYTGKPTVNASLDQYWYLGEPIWITNERDGSGRKSAVLDWPMGEASYRSPPHKPNFVRSWKGSGNLRTWINDTDELLNLFTRAEDPVNFAAWYVAEPDATLHRNGFYNGEFKKTIAALDKAFDYLVARIESLGLDKRLNVILTADHGHAEINGYKSVFCIRDYVLGEGFEMGDHMIYPLDDQHGRDVFANLSRAVTDGYGIEILWKKDIPADWHYANSSRVGQIIINPKIGSSISFSCNRTVLEAIFGPNGTLHFNSSTHGMDPRKPEMRALLAMRGPQFAEGKTISEIPKNVDLYSLICHILKITAAPNNGSMVVVRQALAGVDAFKEHSVLYNVFTDTLGFFVIVLPSACIVILFFIYGCRHTVLKSDPNWARPEAVRGYSRLATAHDEEAGTEHVRLQRRDGQQPNVHSKAGGLLDGDDSSEDEF